VLTGHEFSSRTRPDFNSSYIYTTSNSISKPFQSASQSASQSSSLTGNGFSYIYVCPVPLSALLLLFLLLCLLCLLCHQPLQAGIWQSFSKQESPLDTAYRYIQDLRIVDLAITTTAQDCLICISVYNYLLQSLQPREHIILFVPLQMPPYTGYLFYLLYVIRDTYGIAYTQVPFWSAVFLMTKPTPCNQSGISMCVCTPVDQVFVHRVNANIEIEWRRVRMIVAASGQTRRDAEA
jgi:hypothetical protein